MLHLGARMDAAAEPILATASRMSADWMRDGIVFYYEFWKTDGAAVVPVLRYKKQRDAER